MSVDDLEHAASWLNAYEAEDGDGERHPDHAYTGTDEVAATMYRVADYLRAQAARRREDAAVRDLVSTLAAQGRTVSPKQARAALRRAGGRG